MSNVSSTNARVSGEHPAHAANERPVAKASGSRGPLGAHTVEARRLPEKPPSETMARIGRAFGTLKDVVLAPGYAVANLVKATAHGVAVTLDPQNVKTELKAMFRGEVLEHHKPYPDFRTNE